MDYRAVSYENGKSVWRQFPVSGEETQLLDRIVGSNEYEIVISCWMILSGELETV